MKTLLKTIIMCFVLLVCYGAEAKNIERIQDLVPGKLRIIYYDNGDREWQTFNEKYKCWIGD